MLSAANADTWLQAVHSGDVWVFTLVLALVFPVVDYLLYFRLKSTLQIYVWNVCAEWSLVFACVWLSRSKGLSLYDLGERIGNPLRSVIVVVVLFAIFAVLTVVNKRQTRKPSSEQMNKAVSRVRRMLPSTNTERTVWVLVALTAGLCEEFLYRGWLLNFTSAVLGSIWAGLIISSIVFGLAHAYQGRAGIIGAAVLGLVFGGVFVVSGSLVPVQILHAAMDLNNGLALGKITGQSQSSIRG